MKKVLLLLSLCLLGSVPLTAFDGDTPITIANGDLKPLKELHVGEEILCFDKDAKACVGVIKGVYRGTATASIKIIFEDETTFNTSSIKRFFVPQRGAWVCARDLQVGDSLLTADRKQVMITDVSTQESERTVYSITVDPSHTFFVSEGRYLVHNGPIAGKIGYWGTVGVLGLVVGGSMMATFKASLAVMGAATVGNTAMSTGLVAGAMHSTLSTAAGSSVEAMAAIAVGTVATGLEIGGVVSAGTAASAGVGVSSLITVGSAAVAEAGGVATTMAAVKSAILSKLGAQIMRGAGSYALKTGLLSYAATTVMAGAPEVATPLLALKTAVVATASGPGYATATAVLTKKALDNRNIFQKAAAAVGNTIHLIARSIEDLLTSCSWLP